MPRPELRVIAVGGIAEVEAGADVGAIVSEAAEAQGDRVEPGDVVVIAQKIVSKAEGRLVAAAGRDEVRAVVRTQARRVVRETPSHLIVETTHGFVCANAGVDSSNVAEGWVALLPRDPDASARRIARTLSERAGGEVAVIVSDTFGRPWRVGQTNVAIGSAAIAPLRDHRGETDPAGRVLTVTEIAQIDELAAAAELVMGKIDRVPAAIVRGYPWEPGAGGAVDLVRPASSDLFR
ncbi:MAG TPA: coenzyme F420-0:L-glutamate ligase [Actinomycetota bacterium]|nr:coenzyme F420-0:L-glutamate ligase [Actinomycetota bacterium]